MLPKATFGLDSGTDVRDSGRMSVEPSRTLRGFREKGARGTGIKERTQRMRLEPKEDAVLAHRKKLTGFV